VAGLSFLKCWLHRAAHLFKQRTCHLYKNACW